MGHEAVHDGSPGSPPLRSLAVGDAGRRPAPRAEHRRPARPLRGRFRAPRLRMGYYGLSWDYLGVNDPPAGVPRPADRNLNVSLTGYELKEWLRSIAPACGRFAISAGAIFSAPPGRRADLLFSNCRIASSARFADAAIDRAALRRMPWSTHHGFQDPGTRTALASCFENRASACLPRYNDFWRLQCSRNSWFRRLSAP